MSDGEWTTSDFKDAMEEKYGTRSVTKAIEARSDEESKDYLIWDEVLPEDHPVLDWLDKRISAEGGRDAVNKGHTQKQRYMAGSPNYSDGNRIDATGYDKLLSEFEPAAQQVLLKGAMGSGKTTKAADIARRLVSQGVIDKVITNIEPLADAPEVEFSEDISRILEFAAYDSGEKLIILDEFSTVGNAMVAQDDVEQILGRVINAFRKSENGSNRVLYVGHENKVDIHPLVRRQANVVLHAAGKQKEGLIDEMEVFVPVRGDGEDLSAWKAYQKGEKEYHLYNLQDVSQSSQWSIDTNYFAHLEWDLDNPAEQISRGRIRKDWEKFQEDDEGTEVEVEAIARCNDCKRTTENTSESEGNLIRETGYCSTHIPDDLLNQFNSG